MANQEEARQEGPLWNLHWRTLRGEQARKEPKLLQACADLYSSSYGTWGPKATNPGQPIRRAADDIAGLLVSKDSFLALAELGEEVVGYCVALFTETDDGKLLAWVSQLVVGAAYRNDGVATALLHSVWGFSDRHAWGLVTSNPFAVRALESATRRPCRVGEIRQQGSEILATLADEVPYLPHDLERNGQQLRAVVNTKFYVSHQKLEKMRKDAARGDRPWTLGEIGDGEEWFACTFSGQAPMPLPPEKLEMILVGADRVWMDAFARMTLDRQHRWRQHTDSEIEFLLEQAPLPAGARALDVGCGDGRHAQALAERGLEVVGVDVVPALIERAREESPELTYAVVDAREALPQGLFDLVLLLYDVLGASASSDDDLRMLKNIATRLAPEGRLALSVMNAEATDSRIPIERQPQNDEELLQALEDLPASNTMESTGDIFNPDLLLLYQGIHYRKEQFLQLENYLPSEHVVRDLRYTPASLEDLLSRAGFEIELLRPVQAGEWGRETILGADDPKAKELLVVARRQ